MRDLHDDLSRMARSIVQGQPPSTRIVTAYAHHSADTALDIYRNNYQGNLQDALAGAYPVIKQLVGDEFFRFMARRFIERHPSHSPNLHHYGAELSGFLTDFAPARELVYLPDVAALEWACHLAYFAPDAAGLDLTRLADVPPERYPDLILRIHPACHVVHSRYPIAAIWQAHQPGNENEDFHIDLDSSSSIALVSRTELTVQVSELSVAAADWIRHIQHGDPLGMATDAALAHHPEFDLQAALLDLVARCVLTDFNLSTKP